MSKFEFLMNKLYILYIIIKFKRKYNKITNKVFPSNKK